MSRLSDSRNNSKTVYQGMVLKRTQRSEYEDSKLRDLARHNARLDNEIKTVERARTVMKKSMEADKQLFMKAGFQNNAKMTKSIQAAKARQIMASQAAQHSRLVSDTRVKRSSVSDNDTVDSGGTTARSSNNEGQSQLAPSTVSTVSSAQRSHRDNNNNSNSNSNSNDTNNNNNSNNITTTHQSNNRTSITASIDDSNNNVSDHHHNHNHHDSTTRGKDAKESSKAAPADTNTQPGDSLYDSFFLDNLPAEPVPRPGMLPLATPVRQLDPGQPGYSTSSTRDKRSPLSPGDHTDSSSSRRSAQVKIGSARERTGLAKGENTSGRLRTKWDTLATPKHSSPQLTKRAQIEHEFSPKPTTSSQRASTTPPTKHLGTFTVNFGPATATPTPTPAPASTPSSTTPTVSGATPAQRKKSTHQSQRRGESRGK